jgi:hypothetical protein
MVSWLEGAKRARYKDIGLVFGVTAGKAGKSIKRKALIKNCSTQQLTTAIYLI